MNRTTLQTIAGGIVAFALGAAAAFVQPRPAAETLRATASAPVAASSSETEAALPAGVARSRLTLDGPLAEACRTATGARRWLLLMSASERATAEEMRTLMRIVSDDPAALRALAERWAELDPLAMFHALCAEMRVPEGTPGRIPRLWEFNGVLFEHWTKRDLPGAIRALSEGGSRYEDMRMTFADCAMKTDVEATLRAMSEWGIRHFIPDMTGVAQWAARDPRHAAEVVMKFNSGAATEEALREVGKVWAKADPAGGLRFAATLDPKARLTLGTDIMRTWAGADLQSAAAFATAQDNAFRNTLAPGLVETWGQSDPAAALAWSQDYLQGRALTEAIAGVIEKAAEKNLTTASQLVSDMAPGAAQNRACAAIFETWFKKGAGERAAALEWFASLPDPATRAAAIDRVEWEWLRQDPQGVRDFISGPHADQVPPELINRLAGSEAQKNPEATMEWAAGLGPNRAPGARLTVLNAWLQTRPESAATYVRTLPAGPERESAIRSVAQTLAAQSPEQAGQWTSTLPAADQATVRQTLGKYLEENRERFEAAAKK